MAGLSGRLPARVLRKERLTSLILAVDLRHPLMHRNRLVFINGLPEKILMLTWTNAVPGWIKSVVMVSSLLTTKSVFDYSR